MPEGEVARGKFAELGDELLEFGGSTLSDCCVARLAGIVDIGGQPVCTRRRECSGGYLKECSPNAGCQSKISLLLEPRFVRRSKPTFQTVCNNNLRGQKNAYIHGLQRE